MPMDKKRYQNKLELKGEDDEEPKRSRKPESKDN